MTAKQLLDWPSIAELYHGQMLPGRVYAQLTLLQQQEIIERVGSRGKATYFIKAKRAAADAPLPVGSAAASDRGAQGRQVGHVRVRRIADHREGSTVSTKERFMASPAGSTIDVVIESHGDIHILSPVTSKADAWCVAHLPAGALVRDRYAVIPRHDLEAIEAALESSGLRVVWTDL